MKEENKEVLEYLNLNQVLQQHQFYIVSLSVEVLLIHYPFINV